MSVCHPVIVIPGITASYLVDEYPLKPETVWGLIKKDYERVTPHPDDLRYEAAEPSRVVSSRLNPAAYGELVAELRHKLSPQADLPTPVFTFSYDWRAPLARTVEQFADFVEEVVDRTRLLRHYGESGWERAPRVHLVAHSMGGLIAAGYLDTFGDRRRAAKIVSLATPFSGSFEAVLKIAVGTGDLGSGAPSAREREAARLLPALYHLVPRISGAARWDDGSPVDFFEPGSWQPGVVNTIAEFVRLHGLRPDRRRRQAGELFVGLLDEARTFCRRVERLDLAGAGLAPDDWLCVAGVNSETRVRLRAHRDGPDFLLRSADRENRWQCAAPPEDRPRPVEQKLTGDGTVPLEGAVAPFLGAQRLVCVQPSDFGYWELGDRALNRAAGFHGILPNMNMLHRLIVRHFVGAPDRHGNTWGRPAPGVSHSDWRPAIAGLRNKDHTY